MRDSEGGGSDDGGGEGGEFVGFGEWRSGRGHRDVDVLDSVNFFCVDR